MKAGAPQAGRPASFLCGGAPIPSILIERAASELGIKVCSLWGMTENWLQPLPNLPGPRKNRRPPTGGRLMAWRSASSISTARLCRWASRDGYWYAAARCFGEYYKKPELPTFDAEGWFDSGDLAYMDDEGYIRISGRVKDVLIRGGENVPVVEIENMLYKHPAVAAVAVVGMPDARLGERGCAFIVPRPDHSFDLAAMQAYLSECKMTKQFWPERVEIVAELPRTASGKIQKFKLKDIARTFVAGS